MNDLAFRKPDHFSEPVHGGPVAARTLLSTGAASDTGVAVDKRAVSAGKQFQGVLLTLPVEVTTMASGQSVSVVLTLQDSDASSSGWATLATAAALSVGTTTTTTGTARGVARLATNLLSAKRWLRPKVVFTGSASDTGTDQTAANFQLTFMGANEEPV